MLLNGFLSIPSIVFYLGGLGIILYVLLFNLFSTRNLTNVTNLQVKMLKFLMFLFSLVFASIFTQVYRLLPINFNQNHSLIVSIIILIVVLSISYFILNSIILFLLDKDTEHIKRKTAYNYSVFILAILLFSTIFATQSINVISSNKYEISNENMKAMHTTPDFSKLVYIIQHSQTNYLVFKNLETDNTKIFSLCPTSSTCIEYGIRDLWISQDEKSIFIDARGSYEPIYKLDLSSGKLVDVLPFAMNYERKAVFVNSSVYLPSLTGFNGSEYIKLWNNDNTYIIPIATTNNTNIEYFSISPDLSKLAIAFYEKNQSINPTYINFYTLDHLQPILVGNYTLPPELFINSPYLNFDVWSADSSILYYSLYNSHQSMIFSYNYSNLKNNILLQGLDWYHSYSIDSNNSLLVLNNPMKMYSIQSTEQLLLIRSYNISVWDSSYSKVIVLDQGRIKLMTYEKESNSLFEDKILDAGFSNNDLSAYKFFQQVLVVSTLVVFVSTLIFYRKIEKWISKSPFQNH